MTVDQATLATRRGDEVTMTLFAHPGEAASLLISVADADDSVVPTAEFTIAEAGELRELLRELLELHARRQGSPL